MSMLKAGRPSNLKDKAIAVVRNDINVTSKVTVNFPKTLHKQVKQFAVDQDTTITEVLLQAVTIYMKNQF